MKHKLTKGSEFGCCLFFKRKKKEKKVLNYIAVRTSTQSFWEIFRMAAKRCLVSLCVQTALLIPWVSDVTGINIAGLGERGWECLPLSKAMESAQELTSLSLRFSGGVQLCHGERRLLAVPGQGGPGAPLRLEREQLQLPPARRGDPALRRLPCARDQEGETPM